MSGTTDGGYDEEAASTTACSAVGTSCRRESINTLKYINGNHVTKATVEIFTQLAC